MKLKSKIIYGLGGLLGVTPLIILIIIKSVFVLNNAYDSKLTIDAADKQMVNMVVYDNYNNDITQLLELAIDENGKPLLFTIQEATSSYMFIDWHGGEYEDEFIKISSIQFIYEDDSVSELLSGVTYLNFKNVEQANQSTLLFIANAKTLYRQYFEQVEGAISIIVTKVVAASIGTVLGIATALFIILRKSTKALVKRYWRISVLVALIESTMILGFISWIATDMFQVLLAISSGWVLFIGIEKLAMIKGYLETPTTNEMTTTSPIQFELVKTDISNILAKYKK